MQEVQDFISITKEELVTRAREYANQAYRLIQMLGTKTSESMYIIYSFEKEDLSLENLRLTLTDEEEIPSISDIFLHAFVYENEIHDLFGVTVTGMAVDFKGTFYETAKPFPFKEAPAAKPKKSLKGEGNVNG